MYYDNGISKALEMLRWLRERGIDLKDCIDILAEEYDVTPGHVVEWLMELDEEFE